MWDESAFLGAGNEPPQPPLFSRPRLGGRRRGALSLIVCLKVSGRASFFLFSSRRHANRQLAQRGSFSWDARRSLCAPFFPLFATGFLGRFSGIACEGRNWHSSFSPRTAIRKQAQARLSVRALRRKYGLWALFFPVGKKEVACPLVAGLEQDPSPSSTFGSFFFSPPRPGTHAEELTTVSFNGRSVSPVFFFFFLWAVYEPGAAHSGPRRLPSCTQVGDGDAPGETTFLFLFPPASLRGQGAHFSFSSCSAGG